MSTTVTKVITNTVRTELTYFSPPPDGSKPFNNPYGNDGKPERNWLNDPHTVEIENVRGKEDAFRLDATGFQFHSSPSVHKAFTDDEAIKAEYYPESIEITKKLTGASRIVIFDHTIRRRRPGEDGRSPLKRQPAQTVHVDQTPKSAVARVHRHLPEEDVPNLLSRRFQIINLWRPISHAAYDYPLALCDYRSIDPQNDLVPTARLYGEFQGETMSVQYNPNHEWKYLRGMRPDEFVLIKCHDSKTDGGIAPLTPHTAFQDPSRPDNAPHRESIELRMLVFYD